MIPSTSPDEETQSEWLNNVPKSHSRGVGTGPRAHSGAGVCSYRHKALTPTRPVRSGGEEGQTALKLDCFIISWL